jgi:chromosome segregation ATPase
VTETKEALTAAAEYAQDQRDQYVAKFQQEIDELGTRIEELKNEAEGLNAEAKTKLEGVVRQLDEQRDNAAQKVDQLVTASGVVWKDVEDALAQALQSLEQSYEEARDEFSHPTSPPQQ